jgi:hypothetical protein
VRTAKFRPFGRVGRDFQSVELRWPRYKICDCDHNVGRNFTIKIAKKCTENHHHHGHHYQPQGRSHPGFIYLHECCFLHLLFLRPIFVLQAVMYVYRKYCQFKVFEEYIIKPNLLSSRTYGMFATIEFRSLDLAIPYLQISKIKQSIAN